MRKEFDITDIDAELEELEEKLEELSSDLEGASERRRRKGKKKSRKVVTFVPEPTIKVVLLKESMQIKELTRGMEQLQIAMAEVVKGKNSASGGMMQTGGGRCRMCGATGKHQQGYNDCQETYKLIEEPY